MSDQEAIFELIQYVEGLKTGLRHSWLSNGRQESTAEHTWRMAFIAMILGPKTSLDLNMEKVYKLILAHDLVEIEAPDIPSHLHMQNQDLKKQKIEAEAKAIQKFQETFSDSGKEIAKLCQEYVDKETKEARFAAFVDKIEARTQKFLQPKDKWTEGENNPDQVNKYSQLIKNLANGDGLLLEFQELVKEKREKGLKVNES